MKVFHQCPGKVFFVFFAACKKKIPGAPDTDEIMKGSPVCLLLQDLLQSCVRGGRGTVKDVCYEVRRAEARVD